ncbi:LOW QUALITY PROTEIN: hypothetical protein NC651_004686 [Populus alba x Populus x berolinensis]|nr:LOW QUALITY PROTEIN: hypothetical protein NC651_004686 [Populus alba x Populus x berolinensis]
MEFYPPDYRKPVRFFSNGDSSLGPQLCWRDTVAFLISKIKWKQCGNLHHTDDQMKKTICELISEALGLHSGTTFPALECT